MQLFKGKLLNSKGLTLIELIVSISIASIAAVVLVTILLQSIRSYKNNTDDYRSYFYLSEALMFVQHEINNSKDISIQTNNIELKFSEDITKIIKLNPEGSLEIVHKEKGSIKAVNNIINNIGEFNVIQKDKVIYITAALKNGERYKGCIGIKR
ncbi:type II secretion system protein [Clostridium sp. YIM B02515]|uniref:Type II secretion system protein n=1 Tax=Clostridium rhizosphaerae TaxID=2803861 RepID=A0ABS1THV3_9CLOT|nr:type II secretion system protein [Clostridium rhizosphaerae]MBL4937924.1 type II secretion system protein [Clostridium rhizosphaerae]